MDIFLVKKPDLVITDWMIPKADEGIEFCDGSKKT
jgi:CheY-like chemotaxis protein